MNAKQIAEEAARQIAGKLKHANVTSLWIEDIIHAAIEKVDEQWRERFRKFEKIEEKFGPASQRAAHASEPSDQIAAAAGASKV